MYSKAKSYLDASQNLINTKKVELMTCSIAYSYYAVLLYMKFVLNETSERPISYGSQIWPEENMHKRVLQEVENRIKDNKKGKSFRERVCILHEKRVSADYGECTYTVEDALLCRDEALSLIALLKTLFGNMEP